MAKNEIPKISDFPFLGLCDGFAKVVDSSIMQGVPVIMSTPHFLDGDPELAAAIDGIQPVHDKHVTYLHVEPLSGGDITWHAS